jgi:pimeloyl-ACP methyl ester carboxylesterase
MSAVEQGAATVPSGGLAPEVPLHRAVPARARPWATAAGGAVAAGAILYLLICGYVALALTATARKPFTRFPEQYGLSYETVAFSSRVDHVPLEGWLLAAVPEASDPAATRRPVVIVHGKGGDREDAADGKVLEIAAALVKAGHPVLLFDLRGSGRSGGAHFTLGAQEVRDVGGALDFLQQRGLAHDGIDLLGYSMGAATVLLDAPYEPAVHAVVEDSSYADLGSVIDDQFPRMSGLPGWFAPGVILMARPLLGVDAYSIRPVEGAARLAEQHTPLLVIHGEADTLIPVIHGRRIAARYGPGVQTLFVSGAKHTAAYSVAPQTYLSKLLAFLAQ